MQEKKKALGRKVIVATTSRPWCVVFGTVTAEFGQLVELSDARMIEYWDPDETKGIYGLAARGVGMLARVTDRVTRARIYNAEQVIDASPEAVASIEMGPWGDV